MSDLKRYCFDHQRVVLQQHVDLHDDCDCGEAFIARAGPGDVLMSEAEWWAKLPDGGLYVECEHLRDEDLCDVMCDAYVRGDGMVKVERGTDECQNPLGCRCVVADGRWISVLDDATCDWCHSRERGSP